LTNPYNAPGADLSQQGGNNAERYQPRVFSTKGRIGRVRYIAYSTAVSMVFVLIFIAIAAMVAMSSSGEGGAAMIGLMAVVLYIPLFAVGFIMAIRRVHDMGHSGWLSLLILVPLVNLWFLFAPGTDGPNEYGPQPVKNSTGVIVAAFSPFILAIVFGILAAIAIPAYQSYVMRAQEAAMQNETPAAEVAPD
jgi:uncharacterized membrane protein YhaH (DUF805 family)